MNPFFGITRLQSPPPNALKNKVNIALEEGGERWRNRRQQAYYSIPLPSEKWCHCLSNGPVFSDNERFFWVGSPPLWLIFAYKLISSYLPNNWVCIDCVFIFLFFKKKVCVWRAVFFNCLSWSYLWSVLLLSLVWGVRRHFILLKIMLFYPDGWHYPVQSGWSCSTFMTWYRHHCRLWYEYNNYIHPYWFVCVGKSLI